VGIIFHPGVLHVEGAQLLNELLEVLKRIYLHVVLACLLYSSQAEEMYNVHKFTEHCIVDHLLK
jgi:hypothetical protein